MHFTASQTHRLTANRRREMCENPCELERVDFLGFEMGFRISLMECSVWKMN